MSASWCWNGCLDCLTVGYSLVDVECQDEHTGEEGYTTQEADNIEWMHCLNTFYEALVQCSDSINSTPHQTLHEA